METGASAADNGRTSKEFIPTCTVSCAHAPASLLPPCVQARKAQAITKTQARRPRYRMTGIATLTGRFSVAVGTIREASNVIPCIVLLLLAVNPPSPEVVHDRAPVPPGRASWYDHIDTNWPMMFRIASACHSPASRPPPPVLARKTVRHTKEGIIPVR